MGDQTNSDLRENLRSIAKDAEIYFSDVENALPPEVESPYFSGYRPSNPYYFWNQLTEELQDRAIHLVSRLIPACAQLGDLTRASPLTGLEDLQDVKVATKAMRAALQLRKYIFHEADVIHDEGAVLGFKPAGQSENEGLSPRDAYSEFSENVSVIGDVLKLVEAGRASSSANFTGGDAEATKYRAGTAFIMMWMDPKQPELLDVVDTARNVFRSFGIRAQRADDIEHEGLITERVLNEIRTSEFLFADLTGARPNVYYEVGYAHALGKRVILFRKSGTGLHFDLSGYNCPEYENQRDLKSKLTARLISLTNRNPSTSQDI